MLDNLPGSMTMTEIDVMRSENQSLKLQVADLDSINNDLMKQLSDAHCRISDLQRLEKKQ